MHESILNFAKQFEFAPQIVNGEPFSAQKIVVGGMGGSHLSADLLKMFCPGLDIYVHRDYGLPGISREILKESLLVASSYSGNTEETIDFLNQALADGLRPYVIVSGGKLLEIAKERGLPYIELPNNVIQPRVAVGLSMVALSYLCGQDKLLHDLRSLSDLIDPASFEKQGKAIANLLLGKVPLIYSSERNFAVAYNWKIKINETAKIPAFCDSFPEFNHNEMAGFDTVEKTGEPKAPFHVVFLKDKSDHPRIQRRMQIMTEFFVKKGIETMEYSLEGESLPEKAFSALVVADWTAYYLALLYKTDPDTTPLIADFKQKMSA